MRTANAVSAATLICLSGAAVAQEVTFLPFEYYVSDLSEDGRVGAGNLAGPFETFRWTEQTGPVLLGEATVPVLGNGAGSPDISYDGTRISATILTEDAMFATQGIWIEGEGWTRAIPPLAPDSAPIDQSYASAWGLSGDGETVTGFYWASGSMGPFGGAQPSHWSEAGGLVALPKIAGRNGRVNGANFDGTIFCGWEENDFGQWQPTVWRNGVKIRLSDNDAFVGAEQLTADGNTVVGNSLNTFTLNREPTIWTWNGTSYDEQRLGVLPGTPAINGFGIALGVTDDASMVVGVNFFSFSPGGPADGWVWTAATGLVEAADFLATLGIDVSDQLIIRSVDTISADGSTIVISGVDPVSFIGRSAVVRIVPDCANAADIAGPFGTLNNTDINAFVSGFLAQDPIADLNSDGLFNNTDINIFVADFIAGCP